MESRCGDKNHETFLDLDNNKTIDKKGITSSPNTSNEFRLYQFVLFLLTQAGYFAVAGTMLHTTFSEPLKETCHKLAEYVSDAGLYGSNDSNLMNSRSIYEDYRRRVLENEFHSLSVEWNEECGRKKGVRSITIVSPSVLMGGAIAGAFGAGFLADRFGRKPTVISCLLAVCLTNLLIAIIGGSQFYDNDGVLMNRDNASESWQLSPRARFLAVLVAVFVSGAACGGYMVTNVVFLVEALHNSARLRLLVVSLNGWPLGMIFVALVGLLSAHWRVYHLVIALAAISVVALLEMFSLESHDWHLYRGDRLKALKVREDMLKRYAITKNENRTTEQLIENNDTTNSTTSQFKNKKSCTYSYIDLFKYGTILLPLAQLSYCFFSSSVVSYGLFFSVDALPGNRYLNLSIMGLGKFTLGIASFLLSFRVGRRTIMTVSLGISCVLCWLLLALITKEKHLKSLSVYNSTKGLSEETLHTSRFYPSLMITWLALALTAVLDPIWKINHLLSTELFPIQVRNMSRGLCNVAARIGSMAGPLMIYLRMLNECLPFWVYSLLLTIQFFIAFTFSETKDRSLPTEMPLKKRRTDVSNIEEHMES